MTHTPPIPAANQSPYPLRAAPHPQRDAVLAEEARRTSTRLVFGTVAALGAAAIAAAGLWAFASRPKPKPRKRKGKRGKG